LNFSPLSNVVSNFGVLEQWSNIHFGLRIKQFMNRRTKTEYTISIRNLQSEFRNPGVI